MLKGEYQQNEAFRIMVPDSWQFAFFENSAMQVWNPSGSFMISLKKEGFNMTEADETALFIAFAERYKGTAVESVEWKEQRWNKTTYDFGSHQTLMTCIYQGHKISIQLAGPTHETHEVLQSALQTLEIL